MKNMAQSIHSVLAFGALTTLVVLSMLPWSNETLAAASAPMPELPAIDTVRLLDSFSPEAPADPIVAITSGATAVNIARLDESLLLFAANGLVLPRLDVLFFDSEVDCGDHLGVYRRTTMPPQIRICSDSPFVLTHELAHAWEAANVSDQLRNDYLTERGLPTWGDHNFDWNERGQEDAAFIIQQNLTTSIAPSKSSTWQDRMVAYEMLTGTASPLREA